MMSSLRFSDPVFFVVVKLTGCDANEKWCKNEGSENSVPAIVNSVSVPIKLYGSHHDFTISYKGLEFVGVSPFRCIVILFYYQIMQIEHYIVLF